VVLAVVLAVSGVTLAILHARSLTQRFIAQAEPQARQLANTARNLFDEKVRAALNSINDDPLTPAKYPYWTSPDFPAWIDGLYVWDGMQLKTVVESREFGNTMPELLTAVLASRPLTPLHRSESGTIEILHSESEGRPVCVALMRSRGVDDRPVMTAANIHIENLRSDLLQPLFDMTLGLLEPVASVPGGSRGTLPLSGAMRYWSIRPTPSFLKEQNDAVLYQTVMFVSLTVLSLLTLLAAMWLMMRLVRREVALAEMKSNFVADVSHELKTPLALIRLFGETLQAGRVNDESKRQEYYAVITRESSRLTNLINNILDFARIEAGRKEYTMRPLDVADVVRETYEAYTIELDHHGFTHSLSIQPGLPEILADRDAVARAALNIISNAIKYCGEECYLHIDVRSDTRRGRHGVLVSFEDHGIGISPEDRQHLFEGFFRSADSRVRSKRGTGLGLSLVKHIVDAHGGHLDVESRLVRGTTFRMFLPVSHGPAGAHEVADASSPPAEALPRA
jgi:signal transduction histidine kinase